MDHKEARAIMRAYGVNSLLTKADRNPKIAKGLGYGVYTAPMHLAPANVSGFNVCAMATKGCKAACLHTAGNPAFMAQKIKGRLARTKAFFRRRDAFMVQLVHELEAHERKALKLKMQCGVRLNATSDIRFESIPCERNEVKYRNVMEAFPNIQFYDYTKLPNRRNLPKNYHLTFSLADGNRQDAINAMFSGINVAAVFRVTRGKSLPQAYELGNSLVPVLDGDLHDYRPADPKSVLGVIIGLRAKGKARKDKSGFVIDLPAQ